MAYRGLFRLPGVPAQALFGFLSQLTQQVAPVGTVLVVQSASGSLVLAGVAAAAFSIGAGMARPVQGRMIDRGGPRGVLAGCALVHVAALVAVVVSAGAGWVVVVFAWVAGAGLPPVSMSMRIEWGRRMPVESRTAAYSLTYLVQELAMLTGPLLFGLVIAVASASLALGAVAAAAGAGTLAFSRLLRATEPAPSAGGGRMFGHRGMWLLLAVVVLFCGGFGALEVAVPALATAQGSPAVTGLLIAALSVGGIIGAAVYGTRQWRSRPAVRLTGLLAVFGVALGPLGLVSSPPVFWVVLLCTGLALNPALTTTSLLVDELAPGAEAEAFGWISTAIGTGGAAGAAVAGVVGERFGTSTPFLVASGFACLGAALSTLLLRRRT
ncbi:MFS transporter [Nonomuraea rhizosphaerae]|uniref:MFS transporter n=1 Tax=Nonomuraea rhizosphaerae TaxID=2665663 RepID=UPI001C5DFF98|nr:MFS transporter [Nonomuraea rhizosphaerae]